MVLHSIIKPVAIVATLAGLTAYAAMMLRGPQGLGALTEKHHVIRQIEEENADLARQNELKRKRIEDLKSNADVQETEIRKRTGMQRQGETKFVIPDAPSK